MRRSLRLGCFVSALALLVAGCEDATPGPTTPTDPVLTTETFTGTLTTNGGVSFPFGVVSSGTVTATLTSVTDPELVIGIALGTWNGTSCAIVVARDQANQGDAVVGTAGSLGNLCVRVYDVGNVTDPQDITISVEHP
jgi:hypothetical protein